MFANVCARMSSGNFTSCRPSGAGLSPEWTWLDGASAHALSGRTATIAAREFVIGSFLHCKSYSAGTRPRNRFARHVSLFSGSVLGVMLFLTGGQLALGSCDFGRNKVDRFVTLITAAATIWNVGIAFVLGVVLHVGFRKRWFRL
jgi:hypothetical protein